jgi:hypothetical protein
MIRFIIMPARGAIAELRFQQERAEARRSGWSRMNLHGIFTRCSIEFTLGGSIIPPYPVGDGIEIALFSTVLNELETPQPADASSGWIGWSPATS